MLSGVWWVVAATSYLSVRLVGECFPASRHSNQHITMREMGKRTHLRVNHSLVKAMVWCITWGREREER